MRRVVHLLRVFVFLVCLLSRASAFRLFGRRLCACGVTAAVLSWQGNPIAWAASATAPAIGTCVTESNPQTTTQTCRVFGLVDKGERVRGCQANENCFSTSAQSGGKRVSPWLFQQSGADAATILFDAVKLEGLKVLQNKESEGGRVYILAAEKGVAKQPPGSSVFFEFLIKPDSSPAVVLYRTVIDKTVFVYPLQQPIGDFDYLKQKLEKIRARTGFRTESAFEGLPEEPSDFDALRGIGGGM